MRQSSHHFHAWNIGITCEQSIIGHPSDATWRVAWCQDSSNHHAVSQIDLLAIVNKMDTLGIGKCKGHLVVTRDIQFLIKELSLGPFTAKNTSDRKSSTQFIQSVDVIIVTMSKQYSLELRCMQ